MILRWEKESENGWWAYSGELVIGMVGQLHRGVRPVEEAQFYYKISAVHMKWIGKGSGHVNSMSSAKRAVERAWGQWLRAAGLV